MATEYKLSYTADEINERLGKIDELSGGGVSSWNDLEDRPFYDYYTYESVMAEQTCSFFLDTSGLYCWSNLSEDSSSFVEPIFDLVSGETYKITFDSVDYNCVAFDGSFGTETGIGVGNMGLIGGTDTGEPFLLGTFNDTDQVACYVVTGESHTIGIDVYVEKTKTLDEKYLPKDAIESMIDSYINEALGGEY